MPWKLPGKGLAKRWFYENKKIYFKVLKTSIPHHSKVILAAGPSSHSLELQAPVSSHVGTQCHQQLGQHPALRSHLRSDRSSTPRQKKCYKMLQGYHEATSCATLSIRPDFPWRSAKYINQQKETTFASQTVSMCRLHVVMPLSETASHQQTWASRSLRLKCIRSL